MTHDLDRFKKTLVYSRTAPIDALLQDMAELRAFDGKNEKQNALWMTMGIVGLLGLLVGLFSFLSYKERPGEAPPALWLIPGISGVLTLVGFTMRIGRSGYNLENRRYELAERVLRFLRRDSRPDAEVLIEVDFRKPTHKEKHIRKGNVGVWSVNYYTDRWLQVRGRLLDGTSYQLRALEHLQVRTKNYKGRSGKAKSKTKHKSASELILGLKVKTRRYPRLHAIHSVTRDAPKAVQLPEWATLKACRVEAPASSEVGNILLRTTTKQAWTCAPAGRPEGPTSGVRWFAMSILSLYQVLNIARAPEKA